MDLATIIEYRGYIAFFQRGTDEASISWGCNSNDNPCFLLSAEGDWELMQRQEITPILAWLRENGYVFVQLAHESADEAARIEAALLGSHEG